MIANKKIILAVVFLCIYSIVSGTTYYVSSSGNDASDGKSISTPWATIDKVNGFSFAAGDNILFNRGDSFYGTLKITSSGTSANHIKFGAYGAGANPIITGFTTISGWTNYGGGIFSKTVSCQSAVNMVTVDGVNTAMGRYPDLGNWLTTTTVERGTLSDNELPSSPNWTGAEMVMRTDWYITTRGTITSHSGTTINYSGSFGPSNGYPGGGYFIQNDIRTLTTLGEWYYNGTSLYMYFGSVDPTTKTVKVASLDNGVSFNSNSYLTIDNINFQGFNGVGLVMESTNHISVTNCEVGFTGSNIASIEGAPNLLFDNCYLHDINASGFGGSCDYFTFTNSILENVSMIYGTGYGYNGVGKGMDNWGNNILIQYSTFKNIGADGLMFTGSNILIDKNLFDNCAAMTSDQGAIYLINNNSPTNRVISNNIILNTIGSWSGLPGSRTMWTTAEGIYFDEPCSNVTITGNTVANIANGCGIKFHETHDVVVTNNTLYNNFQGLMFQGSGFQPNDPIRNVTMSGNKIIAVSPEQYMLVFISVEGAISQFGTANDQIYARPYFDGKTGLVNEVNYNVDFWAHPNNQGDDKHTFTQWKTLTGQDLTSTFSPVSVSNINNILYIYNASKSDKVVSLDGSYLDVTGTKYSGSITLLPYTSAVLMVDPNPSALPTSPAYVSSAIENSTPALLEMTYNLSLANIVPPVSAFSVQVNSTARTVNSVVISGTKVLLTLSSPIVYGDVVTISYTKPSSNPLQTPAGGQATTLSAQMAVNNVTAATPVYVSSVIQNATPTVLEMTYIMTLANIIPPTSAFSVSVNSTARTVNAVAISGTKVQLSLASPIVYGDVVTVSYTKPATNPLQTVVGGQAASLSAQTVVNNVSSTIPYYVSSAIQNANPGTLEISYSLNLAIAAPSSAAFSVRVNSVARTVNTVSVSGTKVNLTLASPVIYGDVVTVAYTKPATNPIQTPSGVQAATISAQTVTNNVDPGAAPLYVISAIENATPNILEMTYNLSLANIAPAASAFAVTVNSLPRSVNTVSISGTKVLLTLASSVFFGDIVTIGYTKPASNPLQTTSAGFAATINAQPVTNRVSSPTTLSYINSAIGNSSPAVLEINFNLNLAIVAPPVSAFTVRVNSVSRNVNSVTISGTSVLLTLASEVLYGDIVTVAYTKPATNPLQSTLGLMAASMGAQSVTNKVNPGGPVYVSSVIENITPNTLEITYNEPLDLSVPSASAFIVKVNGVKREVTLVSISGNKVILTLSSPVVYGDLITVSYIKPANNQLKKATGETAESFSTPQPVTNKLAKILIKKGDITIYPNPAHEFVNISIMEASLEHQMLRIFDLSGKLCMESQLNAGTTTKVLINFNSGIYILQVLSGSTIKFVQKLIVD